MEPTIHRVDVQKMCLIMSYGKKHYVTNPGCTFLAIALNQLIIFLLYHLLTMFIGDCLSSLANISDSQKHRSPTALFHGASQAPKAMIASQ